MTKARLSQTHEQPRAKHHKPMSKVSWTRRQQQDHELFFSKLCPELRSPTVQRILLRARLYDLYASQDGARFPGFKFFADKAASHVVMRAALDVLCLLTIAQANRDKALLHEAYKRYGAVLRLLREELHLVPVRNPFTLLQALHVVQLCEMFQSISLDGWGWQKHMAGIDGIIEGASDEGRKDIGEQGRVLIRDDNRISFPLWNALLFQQRLATGEELFGTASISFDTVMASRLPIDRQVPGVLQYCQHVLSAGRKASKSMVSDAVELILGMEGRLHASLSQWYAKLPGMAYRTTTGDSLGSHMSLTKSSQALFPVAFLFSDMASVLKHVHYWMCLLSLRQMHLHMRGAVRASTYLSGLYESREHLLCNANDCAENLCMSISFMTQPSSGYFGFITAIPPIHMASRWFKAQKNDLKLRFCQEIASWIQSRGLAVPSECLE